MMKKIIVLSIVLIFSSLVIAEQPKLLNHQFYGEVIWAKDSPVPSALTAMLGSGMFTAEIRSSPCLEDPCKGRYGYDPDNILRVQGESGNITFMVDNLEAGEYQYQEDAVTKLDFDLRPEEEIVQVQDKDGNGLVEKKKAVNKTANETVDEVIVDEVVETPSGPEATDAVVKKPEPLKVVPKEIPSFQMPSAAAKEVKKREGINFYLIGGVVLIAAAAALITFLIIKRRKQGSFD